MSSSAETPNTTPIGDTTHDSGTDKAEEGLGFAEIPDFSEYLDSAQPDVDGAASSSAAEPTPAEDMDPQSKIKPDAGSPLAEPPHGGVFALDYQDLVAVTTATLSRFGADPSHWGGFQAHATWLKSALDQCTAPPPADDPPTDPCAKLL